MSVLTVIAILGGVQGFLVVCCIASRQRHWKNLPLALLIIVFSLRSATIPTWNAATLLSHPWIYPLTAPLPFLFGPLLWWYIRTLGRVKPSRPRFLYFHFLPYILEVSAIVIMLILMTPSAYALLLERIFAGRPPLWLTLRNGAKVILNIIYFSLGAKIAFGRLSKKLSSERKLWLRSLMTTSSLVLPAFSYVALAPRAPHALLLILSLLMAIFIYLISFLLLIAPEPPGPNQSVPRPTILPSKPVYTKLDCERTLAQLEKLFADGAAQDPNLKESDLAAELKIPANRISYAINTHYGMSFPRFLNEKRIQYFTGQVEQGALEQQSILSLAFDAGFPSKSTFNRVFKDICGITPTEYAKECG